MRLPPELAQNLAVRMSDAALSSPAVIRALVGLLGIVIGGTDVSAQTDDEESQEVVIERVALTLKDPEVYRVHLILQPITSLPIPAQTDGEVNNVMVDKIGTRVRAQAELLRLKSEERLIEQRISEAELEAAKAQLKATSDPDRKPAAEADVIVAQRKLELAEFRVGQTVTRAPWDGEIARIFVTKGDYVRTGQPLVTMIDQTKLVVEVPIERGTVEADQEIDLTVEDRSVQGTVTAIVPATNQFAALRDLFLSVALARVVLDNSQGKLAPGQAVISEMIPRHPVAEVPNAAVKNGLDGKRIVQVIRNDFVRDLPIQILGQVGETHVFVSARFSAADELIVSSSEEMEDGTFVRPAVLGAPEESTPRRSTRNLPPGAVNRPPIPIRERD